MAAKGGNFTSTGFLVSQRFSTACNFTVKTERKTGESVCSFSTARPQGHAAKWLVAGTVHLALTDVVAALVPSVAMETLHNGFAARWLRVFTLASAIARVGKTLPSSDDEDTDPSSWLSPPHSCWAFAASRMASHSVLVLRCYRSLRESSLSVCYSLIKCRQNDAGIMLLVWEERGCGRLVKFLGQVQQVLCGEGSWQDVRCTESALTGTACQLMPV